MESQGLSTDNPMSATYDMSSSSQLEANQHNLPQLIEALKATDPHIEVLHLADFGSATGLNSMKTFSQAFQSFRETSKTQIVVHHVDIPNNNWGVLFNNAVTSPYSYLNIEGTFVEAVGRSNYIRVFPDNFLSVVYSAHSLYWLSRPLTTPNQVQRTRTAHAEILEELSQIAEEDLDQFLLHRTAELKVGGRMILHTNSSSMTDILCQLAQGLEMMAADGLINVDVTEKLQHIWYSRSELDFTKAVAKLGGRIRILAMETTDEIHPYFRRYLEDHDKDALIRNGVTLFKGFSGSLLRKVLSLPEGEHPLLEEFYKRFGEVVGELKPFPYNQLYVILEKVA